jgi:hypothetical protein
MLFVTIDVEQRRIRRRLGRRRAVHDRERLGIVEAGEKVGGRAGTAGGRQGLEVLLGTAGDAGHLQAFAQQRAAAAGRRTDEVRDMHGP